MRFLSKYVSSSVLSLLLVSLHLITAMTEDKIVKSASTKVEVDPTPAKRSVIDPPSALGPEPLVPNDVDEGDATKRIVRGSMMEYEDDEDEDSKNIVPELIPIAENRKARGNGADDLNALDEDGVEVVAVDNEDGVDRDVRDGLDGDIEMDADGEGRALKCSKDGETCQENSGCCSGFCSWTRGFTCFTVAG